MQTILVTGGSGYIGSHICVELLAGGYDVVVLDNLSNSSRESLRRVERIAGRAVIFEEGDILDKPLLARLFAEYAVAAVIHLAGLKAVGESVSDPLRYYHNNVAGSRCLLQAMAVAGVQKIVFSSSATVYGNPVANPVPETAALQPTNPYGRTKLFVEEILRDLAGAGGAWHSVILRYFNPVGAHVSGLIGEDYPTRDGTGVRDYIHVVDLARGHVAALSALAGEPVCEVFNLGTGQGYSVLEMVDAFARCSGVDIPYDIVARRPGDIAECCADPGKAWQQLGWRAELGLEAMCADTWRWQQSNPDGYII